jgi:hypothetical protein
MTNEQYWTILMMAKQSLENDFSAKFSFQRQNGLSLEEMNKLYAVIKDEAKSIKSTA